MQARRYYFYSCLRPSLLVRTRFLCPKTRRVSEKQAGWNLLDYVEASNSFLKACLLCEIWLSANKDKPEQL
jgi:hypothetical protein